MALVGSKQGGGFRPPLEHWRAVLLLAAISVLMFWKLTLTSEFTWLEGGDIRMQVLPWFQMQAREVHAGRLPLWDPYQFGGQPLLGQAQPGTAYPLNWILFSLPLKDGFIRNSYLNWYFVVIHWMAAVFAYAFARDIGRSFLAGIFAGCLFAFGGFIGTLDWPQMLNGAVWLPLVVLYARRAFDEDCEALIRKRWSSAAWSGFYLGVAWLSGHHQAPIFTTLTLGFLIFYWNLRKRALAEWRWRVPAAALAGLTLLLTSALQTLPAIEYGRQAYRWVGTELPVTWNQKVPYSVHTEYSSTLGSMVGMFLPDAHRHTSPFVGIVGLSVAAVGLLRGRGQRQVRIWASVALGGWLMALGAGTAFHGILYSLVPMVEKARLPAAAVLIFHFGVCALSAWGIDSLSTVSMRLVARVLGALLGVGTAVVLWFGAAKDERILLVAFFVALIWILFVFYKRSRDRRPIAFALTALLCLELSTVCGANLLSHHYTQFEFWIPEMRQTPNVVDFMRTEREGWRVDVKVEHVPYNFGDWYGVRSWDSRVPSLYTKTLDLAFEKNAWKLFSVRYPVVRKGAVGSGEYHWTDQPGALPRARLAHRAIPFDRSLTDLTPGTVMIDRPVDLDTCSTEKEKAWFLKDIPNEVELEVDVECKAMLVLGDNYDPGWRATVDKTRVEILPVYGGALRGVLLHPGRHRVRFMYRPLSVMLGAGATLAGLAVAVGLAVWARDRSNPAAPRFAATA